MRISDLSSDVCSSDLVFSTRPDTIFGASFAAIAADHPIALALAEKDANLAAFAEECRHSGTAAAEIETQDKKGYDTGLSVIHPFDQNWKLPLFIANFVLMRSEEHTSELQSLMRI